MDSFVDLTYRGLEVGRRIKLVSIETARGYLELPTPMPVGAELLLVTDEGPRFDVSVRGIHEQVGGSDQRPGMWVVPRFADDAAQAWWLARVTDAGPVGELGGATKELTPEQLAAAQRLSAVTTEQRDRARTRSIPAQEVSAAVASASTAAQTLGLTMLTATLPGTPMPPGPASVDDALADAPRASDPPIIDDGRSTTVMAAVSQELLEQIAAEAGSSTEVMAAVDPETSGSFDAAAPDAVTDGPSDGTAKGKKKRSKKR